MELLFTILIYFGIAALAINIAYFSTLAYEIKKLLGLIDNQRLNTISKYEFWKLFLPMPINILAFIPTLIIKTFKKLQELLNCQYCTSWWLGFGYALYSNYPVVESIAFGGFTIVAVIIIERFMCKEDVG